MTVFLQNARSVLRVSQGTVPGPAGGGPNTAPERRLVPTSTMLSLCGRSAVSSGCGGLAAPLGAATTKVSATAASTDSANRLPERMDEPPPLTRTLPSHAGWAASPSDHLELERRPQSALSGRDRMAPPSAPQGACPATLDPSGRLRGENRPERPARERDRFQVVHVRDSQRQTLDAGVNESSRLLGDPVRVAGHHRCAEALLGYAGASEEIDLGHRRLVRRRDRQDAESGLGDLGRLAPDVLAMARQHLHQVLGPRRVTQDVATVGVLGDQAQRFPLAAAADDDRNVATQRLGVVQGPVDAEVAALEGGALLREHGARDLKGVLEHLEAPTQRREVEADGAGRLLQPRPPDREPSPT